MKFLLLILGIIINMLGSKWGYILIIGAIVLFMLDLYKRLSTKD
jgi:hypothetical protein